MTGEVTGEVGRLLSVLQGEMKRVELQAALGLRHEDHFREAYLVPALDSGLVEMTIPDKPQSRLQKYRLTAKGKAWLASRPKPGHFVANFVVELCRNGTFFDEVFDEVFRQRQEHSSFATGSS